MSNNYYYLVAGMTETAFDDNKLEFYPKELKSYLKESLKYDDYKQLANLYLQYDNQNVISYVSSKIKNDNKAVAFNDLANYSYDDIVALDKNSETVENEYINGFFSLLHTDNDQHDKVVYWEKQLLKLYYEEMKMVSNKFIRTWFEFEFALKNIQTAIICRNNNLNIEQQVFADDEIFQNLAKSNAKDFGLSVDVPYVDKLIAIYDEKDLQKRERAIDMMKWNWIDENTVFDYFTFEAVVAIVLKTRIIERWIKVDVEEGKKLFVKLLEDMTANGNIDQPEK